MHEITTESVTSSNISMNEAPDRAPISRKQQSEERKAKFFEQLEAAHKSREEETPREEPRAIANELHDTPQEVQESKIAVEQESDEDDELSNKLIPKKRFDKEIEKRKLLEAEVRTERDARIKYQTEMELYNKALDTMQESKRANEPELNVIDEDAHRFYMNKIDALEKKYESQTRNLTDYEQRQSFTSTVNHQAAEMSRTHPDFNDAYSYLLNVEANKGKMFGLDDSQAQAYALEQLKPIAWESYRRGQNVAEVAYNIAKSYGYKAAPTSKATASDLDKVGRNMKRSHSALDDIPSVATTPATEAAQFTSFDGFKTRLAGKNGRGVDMDAFRKAIEKVRNGGQY